MVDSYEASVAAEERERGHIDDTGAFIPYARKHLATSNASARDTGGMRLDTLFPEPDWKRAIEDGMPADCAAQLAMIYDGLATVPREGGRFNLNASQWEQAFVDGIALVRRFMSETKTVEQAKKVAHWMAEQFNTTPTEIVKQPVAQVAAYWGASPGGRRTIRPIGSFTLRQRQLSCYLHRLGWPASDLALRTSIVPIKLSDGSWRVARIKGEKAYFLSEALDGEGEAIAASLVQMQVQATASKVVTKRAGGVLEVRNGADVRLGGDISGEDLIGSFCLRGIQFGESVTQAERQRWLNDVYEALCDLAFVLNIPRRWIGLGGLGLAIGARGKGGAMAHYEPDLMVFNFTRMSGSGSLAHEWFHAFDHRLGKKWHSTSIVEALWWPSGGSVANLTALELHMSELCGLLRPSKLLKQAQQIEALPRAKKYWTKPCELAARAFEAWVEDRLRGDGLLSPCLVHGTQAGDYAGHSDKCPYPLAEERERFCACFDRIALELQALTQRAHS